jgi:hypothetical protein
VCAHDLTSWNPLSPFFSPDVAFDAQTSPEVLDPALLRPGRFDRHVRLPLPDAPGRLAILAVHACKVQLASGGVDLGQVAAQTEGLCGADLANVVSDGRGEGGGGGREERGCLLALLAHGLRISRVELCLNPRTSCALTTFNSNYFP